MRRGESILIHAGSGGVGQAAINVCLFYGCDIYTTVGTQEKRDFIRKTFPSVSMVMYGKLFGFQVKSDVFMRILGAVVQPEINLGRG